MSTLELLQFQLQNYLLNDQKEIQHSIVNTEKVSIHQRLTIYHEAYHARLLDSLISNFPLLHAYLGEEIFFQIGHHYIAHFPSSFRSIRWFGDKLAAYFKDCGEDCLSEIAAFEWKMTLAFDAADAETVKRSDMLNISPELWPTLSFTLHPSLQRMQCAWNSGEIWDALSQKQQPPSPTLVKKCSWIIWRKDYYNYCKKIEDDESWALCTLQEGRRFSELCEGLCEWNEAESIGLKAASLLKGWIEAGLITGVRENANQEQ